MTAPQRRSAGTPPSFDTRDDAEHLFRKLALAESISFARTGKLMTASERATERIDAAWHGAGVISFDVFDTLLVRKVASPRDVFLHLATPHPFDTWGLDSIQMAELRQRAENEARRRAMSLRRSGEVTLQEIHAVLAELAERPEADVAAMVAAEQFIERALCVAHPYLSRLFERARTDGKAIWCVSDTYHDTAFLTQLLSGSGFTLDGVLVASSADRRASKGEGKLLRMLAEEAGVAPDAVLHIGDHQLADGIIPQSQGFHTVCHPWAASRPSELPASSAGDAIALGLSQIGSRTLEPAFPFWWRFGYSVAGPLLSAFALWLHERFVADKVDRAYFLLRDGEIILDVYRALVGSAAGPGTALLESSRRAFMLPAIEAGRNAITSQLTACENPRPAREFLERLGVRASDFEFAFRSVGLQSLDEMILPSDLTGMRRVLSLFQRPDVITAVVKQARRERSLLWQYLRQEGVLEPGRIALVDIGWSGTIQKSLVAAASLERTSLDVTGYYLGTLPTINDDLDGSAAQGFLFDAGAPGDRTEAVIQLRQLVEFICTTTRGSLRGFRAEGRRVEPVHSSVDHPELQRAHLAQLRSGALAFARGLAAEQQVFGVQPISPEAALRHLARTIQQPTAEEATCIGDLHHGEGLGADRVRAFAAFRPTSSTPDALMQDYLNAYWPVGLLARREPAALALRSLLWLQSA